MKLQFFVKLFSASMLATIIIAFLTLALVKTVSVFEGIGSLALYG